MLSWFGHIEKTKKTNKRDFWSAYYVILKEKHSRTYLDQIDQF
jgi:hypothetical protein